MTELTAFILGVAVTTMVVSVDLVIQRELAIKRKADELKTKTSVPYFMRNAMEDTATFNIRMLLDIRDFLIILESEINQQRELIGQIRNGQYTKGQPGVKRTNGRIRETHDS